MSRKSRKNRPRRRAQTTQLAAKLPQQETRTNVPRKGGQLIASAENDISIPFYSNILVPQDPTIQKKGPGKGLKLYDEVMLDGRAYTTLSKRYSKVTRREWVVEAASDDAIDVKAAEGMEQILKAMPFDDICKDLLKAILKGFAVSEIVWGRNADNQIMPTKIKAIDPVRIAFDKDWKPRLKTPENSIEGEELPARKFLVHRFGADGNNAYGLGLGAILFWHVLFKREGVTFWMRLMEKFASPTPFGKYPVGTPKSEQDKLLNSLLAMIQQGALVAPIGTEVEFLEAQRAGDAGYEKWCRFWDEQTSEVVLGSTLSTSVKGEGARAAAETHAEETNSLVDDDCDHLSGMLNQTLITWISELNWPNAKPPKVWRPRPKNEEAEEEQKKKQAERQQAQIRSLDAARKQGFEPKDTQDWMSSVFETEMVPIELDNSVEDPNQGKDVNLADDDGPIAHLISQLEDAAGPHRQALLNQIHAKLKEADSYAHASKGLLELAGELDVDPMGRILGDAFALSEMTGRADIIDETGIYPSKEKSSKKKT